MSPHFICRSAGLFAGLFATSAAAQQVSLEIVPAQNDVLEYTVVTKSEMKTDTKRTINGEERAGRRGGGGSMKSEQKLVFQVGPSGTNWRKFITADASVTRPSRQGEDRTIKIASALAGKKIFIVEEDGKIVFKADSATGTALPRRATSGMPAKLTLGGVLPRKSLEVQGKYELKKGFVQALRKLLQPVRAARSTTGGGGQRGRGQGSGGQRGRGQGGRGATAGTWNAAAIRILNSKKLTTKGTGQLVSVGEKDGKKLAVLAIDAEISGAGTPTELGMGRSNRRRGSGGGGGGQNGDTGKATITMKVTGNIVVNQTDHRIQSVTLAGQLQSSSESSRTTNRNGEERKTDTVRSTKGTFEIVVACDNLGPAPKLPGEKPGVIAPIK